jgi:catechol 2,3-dioxygenase-like lactoylglutathione lyase family enzyme
MSDYLVNRLGHVTLEVSDLDSAIGEFTTTGQLEVAETRDGEAFLRGDMHHYWLRLVAGSQNRFVRVGYEAAGPAALAEITRRLEQRGIAVETRPDAISSDRVDQWIRFTDPDGIDVELFTHMLDAPTRRLTGRVRLADLLHAVFLVRDVPASVAFYGDIMGFRVSDWTERVAAFLRCGNEYHHSLAFFGAPEQAGTFHHYAVLCEEFDDVMVARQDALNAKAELAEDLVRHGPSGSVGIYLRSELGFSYEFCVWHGRITDPGHEPRILPAGRSTINVWELPADRLTEARR